MIHCFEEIRCTMQRRTKKTYALTTDPEARLYRKGKGKEAKLCFTGHGLWRTVMAFRSMPA